MTNVFLASSAVLATVAVAAVALAQGDADQGRTEQSRSTAPSGPVSRANLGAFTSDRTAGDTLPSVAAKEIQSMGPAGTILGNSVKAAERGDRSVYLIPAPDAVCLALAEQGLGAAVNCLPLKAVYDGSAAPSHLMTGCTGPPPEEGPAVCKDLVLYGVVPDGVHRVAIETASDRPTELAVSDNVYIYEGPMAEGVKAVHYVTESGQDVRLPVPL